jgi:hypothetical protein
MQPRLLLGGVTLVNPVKLAGMVSRRSGFAALGVWGFLVSVAGCGSGPEPSTCVLAQATMAGNSLTLMPGARMDHTAGGLVLLGSDGASVQWASLSDIGVLGVVHTAAVPDHRDGPWFAVAGTSVAADHVVIAFTTLPPAVSGTTTPAPVRAQLWTFSVAFDGTGASLPSIVATVPDTRTLPVQLAMSSGRSGMHAGLTWAARGAGGKLSALVLDGAGMAIGQALELPAAVDDFDCLRFQPGRGDLTVGYVDRSGTPPVPAFVLTELGEDGGPQGTFRLLLGKQMPGCVELAPTDVGYGLAWHNVEGTFTGVLVATPQVTFNSAIAVGDVRLADGPPRLNGLAYMGRDFALALTRSSGPEVWRIDPSSRRQGGSLELPSSMRHLGTISTQPVGAALFGTYADYSSEIGGSEGVGRRFLVKVTCR